MQKPNKKTLKNHEEPENMKIHLILSKLSTTRASKFWKIQRGSTHRLYKENIFLNIGYCEFRKCKKLSQQKKTVELLANNPEFINFPLRKIMPLKMNFPSNLTLNNKGNLLPDYLFSLIPNFLIYLPQHSKFPDPRKYSTLQLYGSIWNGVVCRIPSQSLCSTSVQKVNIQS